MDNRAVIRVVGARQHNLQDITVEIPRGRMTVITGLSGSGKSSLAFDTIYAEGQRKYVESLSAYARQFLEQLQKPDVDRIEGLSPTLAIEQHATMAGPRSTVATATEIYDFLRVLFARAGTPRCWKCRREIVHQSTAQVVDSVLAGPSGRRFMVLAPIVSTKRGAHKKTLEQIVRDGFVRARIDDEVMLLEDVKPLAPARNHSIDVVVDRLVAKPEINARLSDSVETAMRLAGGRVVITTQQADETWTDETYSSTLVCRDHPQVRIEVLSPRLFSFNSPEGACESCHGLGTTLEFDRDLIVPDQTISLADGAIAAWRGQGRGAAAVYSVMVREFCDSFKVLPDMPYRNIPESVVAILLDGTTDKEATELGASFEGVIPNLKRRWETTESESTKQRLHAFLGETPCAQCGGARLQRAALCVTLLEKSIADVTAMTVENALAFFQGAKFEDETATIAEPLVREIVSRLQFMCDVGVDYLTLNRSGATLAGGEWQRIRLATQIGSGLAGVCYVLDEPTVGLHARDRRRLTKILRRLTDLDNTLIVVEHDDEVIAGADHVIDIGPGAGSRGGRVVVEGSLDDVIACGASITGQFLSGASSIPIPVDRREVDFDRCVELRGVTANNLKNIDVRFPLGCFVCVTGVSGSGKSTLVSQVLLRALRRRINRGGPRPGPFERIVGSAQIDAVVEVDQTPIGRTPRSNPATYVGVFDIIRKLWAQTREARIRGYSPARFSFNVKGGRCEHCQGQGVKRIAMHFLPDVFVECRQCAGTRYNRETLEIRFRGKTIADVLDFHVDDAVAFFENFEKVRTRLQALKDVGLGYITLGQASNTLSGGEAQRVKLASQLHRAVTGHTLYILDEPTTGLHQADVRNLLGVLNRIVDRGQTVLVIEHNLDVIKVADWVIDLGPEGGDGGGEIVAEGPPEKIAANTNSHTGRFLALRLQGMSPLQAARALDA